MHPGYVDFQNFAKGFGFASREAIFRPGSFRNPTRRDFARAVTQGWYYVAQRLSPLVRSFGEGRVQVSIEAL